MFPLWTRRLTAAGAIGTLLLVAVVLFWADRSTNLLTWFEQTILRVGRGVERRYDVDFIDRDDVPASVDQIGHALFWGGATFVVGWIGRNRVPITLVAFAMVGVSMAFEFGQPLLSATRGVEPTDVLANTVGVVFGAIAVALVAAAVRMFRGDRREWFDESVGVPY